MDRLNQLSYVPVPYDCVQTFDAYRMERISGTKDTKGSAAVPIVLFDRNGRNYSVECAFSICFRQDYKRITEFLIFHEQTQQILKVCYNGRVSGHT